MLETTHVSTKVVRRAASTAAPRAAAPASAGRAAALDAWARLDRFLLVGSEDGAYHAGGRELLAGDARALARCLAADGLRTIDRIALAASSGRAQNEPALFSLAMAAKLGDEPTRRAAYAALPAVCATAADLMQFAAYAQAFGGWGRGMRKAVGAWFNARSAAELALQLARHPSRGGWSNRDLLRLAHPRAATPSHDRLFAWAVRGVLPDGANGDPAFEVIVAIDELRRIGDPAAAARLIRDRRVPRECVPAELLAHAAVWDALLADLPAAALLRDLPAMTRTGLVTPGSDAARRVCARLRDAADLCAARVHPLAVLAALRAYGAGRGGRGQGAWQPVASVVDALDAAFYASLAGVQPTGKRTLVALDVSGSMASGSLAGVPGLTPRIASAAMALLTAVTERGSVVVAFTAAADLSTLSISPHQRLDDLVEELGRLPMDGTDCAKPMSWAQKHRIDVDTFVVYTDHETSAGDVHPAQALRAYRDARGIPAKLVVVGMTSDGFGLADPSDAGMLDVVGFDTSTPPVIADFARA